MPYTPITAVGQNFHFVEETPSDVLLQVFALDDPLPEVIKVPHHTILTSVTTGFDLPDSDCRLNITREHSQKRITVRFNFHFEVNDALRAAKILQGSFAKNCEMARHILEALEIDLLEQKDTSNA